jgi:hypothetical protein
VEKPSSHAWIDVNTEVQKCVLDNQDHPQMMEIHAKLKRLSGLMHDAEYVPYTKFVLHDVEDDEKLFHLSQHSVKMVIVGSSTQLLVLHSE